MKFLKSIIFIKDPEINLNFDNYVNNSNKADMGVIETFEHFAKLEGKAEGKLEGIQENQEHTIKNLIIKLGLSDEQIATATEAAIDYVRKIRASLKK